MRGRPTHLAALGAARDERARARTRLGVMEAIILAGGSGSASARPALVALAGRPLAAYQIALLAEAGVERVLISCAAGQEEAFEQELESSASSSCSSASRSRSDGAGPSAHRAAASRNGSRLRAERRRALRHRPLGPARASCREEPGGDHHGCAAPQPSGRRRPRAGRHRRGIPRGPRCRSGSTRASTCSTTRPLRLPERGDHEATTFPELAAEGRLGAWRHEGLWLTVNTPKDLRIAQEFVESHPERFPGIE